MVRVAIVTGGAKRIGKAIVLRLHNDGFNICLHYSASSEQAEALAVSLNSQRPMSVVLYKANFCGGIYSNNEVGLVERCARLIDFCYDTFGRCDVLINNASAYYPTPLLRHPSSLDVPDIYQSERMENEIMDIFGSNALAPLCLIRCFARKTQSYDKRIGSDSLTQRCVVNLLDSMLHTPQEEFCLYTMAKYAIEGLTKAAALELAKLNIRVNAVAPGLCVMPATMSKEEQDMERRKVPLGQQEASVEDIAAAVSFMVCLESKYITGAVLNVDGGYSLKRA